MTDEETQTLEAWLDHYIDHLAGDSDTVSSLDDLDQGLRSEARRRAFTVSELWGREAKPSPGPSPVALAMGFDRLDERVAVSGPSLKAARKAAGLKVSELSRELSKLGWSVSAAELGELESGKRLEIHGTALPLLVARLGIAAVDLVKVDELAVDRLLLMDRVRDLIETASVRLERSIEEVVAQLRPQLAAAQFREHDIQQEDVVEIVQALLEGIE